jgi:Protein of unknown function (DUF3551)
MRTLLASLALVAAALLAAPQVAAAQEAPFCLKSVSGVTNCIYQTMAQCEQTKPPGSADQCMSATLARGTTGQGGQPTAPGMPRQPGSQVPGGGLPPAER